MSILEWLVGFIDNLYKDFEDDFIDALQYWLEDMGLTITKINDVGSNPDDDPS